MEKLKLMPDHYCTITGKTSPKTPTFSSVLPKSESLKPQTGHKETRVRMRAEPQEFSHLNVRDTYSDGEAQRSVKDQERRVGGSQTEQNA